MSAKSDKIKKSPSDDLANCDWPTGVLFQFKDEPGEHDPCYVIMPGGAMLPLAHHDLNGVDQARAQFIVDACNEKLAGTIERMRAALQDVYGEMAESGADFTEGTPANVAAALQPLT